ncbi:MAG TPA: transglycosylase SLT domain-containing protein, partial [Gemmatimonadaceae bacterium]
MKDLRGTYVHYGDALRRRRRVRAGVMLAGLIAAAALGARNWEPRTAVAASTADRVNEASSATLEGAQLERLHAIYNYSRRYKISTDLSTAIFDAAVAERIDPALAFPLVRLESRFNPRALSPVGAVGLTQLMVPTARFYVPGVSREDL